MYGKVFHFHSSSFSERFFSHLFIMGSSLFDFVIGVACFIACVSKLMYECVGLCKNIKINVFIFCLELENNELVAPSFLPVIVVFLMCSMKNFDILIIIDIYQSHKSNGAITVFCHFFMNYE